MSSSTLRLQQRLATSVDAFTEHLASTAPTDTPISYVRALFDAVSFAERPGQVNWRAEWPVDNLQWCTYHALLACFLSKEITRRYYRGAAVNGGDPIALRVQLADIITTVVRLHSSARPPLPYRFAGWVDTRRSPTTLLRFRDTLYIACRGTSSVSDAVADLQVGLRQVNAGDWLPRSARVHAGFHLSLDRLRAPVLGRIEAEGLSTVVFCGHSLGGAVAQLLGLAYARRRRAVQEDSYVSKVVTFGSPHVGDKALVSILDDFIDHQRFFTQGDPIAGVPSRKTKDLRLLWWTFHNYGDHTMQQHWRLPLEGRAKTADAVDPVVRLALAQLRNCPQHRLATYAKLLRRHHHLCLTESHAQARRERRLP